MASQDEELRCFWCGEETDLCVAGETPVKYVCRNKGCSAYMVEVTGEMLREAHKSTLCDACGKEIGGICGWCA